MNKKILAVLGLSLSMLLASCGGKPGSESGGLHTSEEQSLSQDASSEALGDGLTVETALTAEQAIAKMAAAGDGNIVDRKEYYVKGMFDAGTKVDATYAEWTGSCGDLKIDGALNESGVEVALKNGAMDGRSFVIKGYLELYQGAYKIGYLPASVSPTGSKYKPTLVKLSEGSENPDISSSSQAPAVKGSVASLYTADVGYRAQVEGVVGQFTYSGATKKKGFVLFDETGSIVIYDSNATVGLEIGNKVELTGSVARYISSGDAGAAAPAGYIGALQLTDVEILSNDSGNHEIPETGYTETTLLELSNTPVSTDLTSRTYKFDAKLSYESNADYFNVYLHGPDGKSFAYCYTICSGADLKWLEPYSGQYRSLLVTIENAKPATGAWRVIIDKVLEEATMPEDEEMAGYVLDHAVSQFAESYNATVEVDAFSVDPHLEGGHATYACDSSLVEINEESITLNVPSDNQNVEIAITATYGEAVAKGSVSISLCGFDPSTLQTVSIKEAREAEESKEVTIKGVLAQRIYGLGSNKGLAGFYIVDDESSMSVYPTSAELAKLGDAKIGETIYAKGTLGTGLSKTDCDLGEWDCLNDAEIIYQDYKEGEIPTDAIIEGKTVTDLYNLAVTAGEDYLGRIFAVKGKIGRTGGDGGTYSYINYTVADVDPAGKYLTLYTQNSSTSKPPYEWEWLEEYVGKNCDILIAPQNTKGTSRYRWGVVAVLGEIVE